MPQLGCYGFVPELQSNRMTIYAAIASIDVDETVVISDQSGLCHSSKKVSALFRLGNLHASTLRSSLHP